MFETAVPGVVVVDEEDVDVDGRVDQQCEGEDVEEVEPDPLGCFLLLITQAHLTKGWEAHLDPPAS